MNRITTMCLLAVSYLLAVEDCFAKDLLFAKASRGYDWEGAVGQAYLREFDPRMFPHRTWRQRLYCETADAEANETVEIYVKPDGSHWLNCRRAKPALSPLIRHRPHPDQRIELTRKLSQIKISSCEVALPPELAIEVEHLWKAMLPGVDVAPVPEVFSAHGPAFIAFARENHSVKTGRICLAAYDTEAYRRFVEIIDDLKRLCDSGGNSTPTVTATLPAKIRNLTARLSK
jgi:hypothetical protein